MKTGSRVQLVWLVVCSVATGCGPPGFEAAGVFAYAIRDGRPVVLVGEERRARCAGWCWSDFVGTRKQVNGRWEDPVETASREFYQETRHSYDVETIVSELSGREPIPVAGGRVLIFVVEVDDRDAGAIARQPDVVDDEKERYCWLDLEGLLAAADATEGNELEILAPCGGKSRHFFGRALANLRRGGALRPSLDALLSSTHG